MTAEEIRHLSKEFFEYEMREITQRRVILNILSSSVESISRYGEDLNIDKYIKILKELEVMVEEDMKNAESGFKYSKENNV